MQEQDAIVKVAAIATATPTRDSDSLATEYQYGRSEKIIYYLAYGSNLSKETFLGRRGIKPLSQVNVCVPSLRMTFDLAGMPYAEPCFANTELRDPATGLPVGQDPATRTPPKYHKDAWRKPLVGVLYGLTPADFYRVIATEGAGSSYQEKVVDCYPLEQGAATVPMHPSGHTIKGSTLLAPRTMTNHRRNRPEASGNHRNRPDPGYAQPSARYLKLLGDGASQHGLPREYRDYLEQIRPYTITKKRQLAGKAFVGVFFLPFFLLFMMLVKCFVDDRGRAPPWLASLMAGFFNSAWATYDHFLVKVCGDGERTMYAKGGDAGDAAENVPAGRAEGKHNKEMTSRPRGPLSI